TPLIISGPAEQNSRWYQEFAKIAPRLRRGEDREGDYDVDEKKRTVGILESGVEKVEDYLGIENLYDPGNTPLVSFLNNALKAKELFKKDKDYVVVNGEVLIVDEFTGRMLHGRRYNEGMHQSIEAKEGVQIQNKNQTFATITLQNYFRLYDKLAGMTGTAMTEANEFAQIYKLGVVPIPTNKPMIRLDVASGACPRWIRRRTMRRRGPRPWIRPRPRWPRSTRRSSRSAACTCWAPSGTSRAVSTTSCAAGPAARVTRVSPGSTCPSKTT